jgi:hypothetical protein
MIRTIFKFVIPAVLLLLVACRGAVQVLNVNSAPVVTSKSATVQDVEKAISRAGATMGWQMAPQGPGKMEGVLVLRNHRAVVDINYDAKNYTIKYKDSSNLQYDGTTIHPNYNGWIQNLDKAIRAQLTYM